MDKRGFPLLVEKYLDKAKFTARFVFTEYEGHALELAAEAAAQEEDIVVAVGGDGTINEVASGIAGTRSIMGIVPCGSGNGLALSLGLSLNNEKAVAALNALRVRIIDSGLLNGQKFFNMAGIGFDAHISHEFARLPSRGFLGYVRTAFTEIVRYKSQQYRIEVDGSLYERTAFMISIANSPQYGNNAYISPEASLSDGLLDLCIVKPFPLALFPAVALRMFRKTAHKSRYVEIIKGKNIRIVSYGNARVHLDGEPRLVGEEILISVEPSSLSVLY